MFSTRLNFLLLIADVSIVRQRPEQPAHVSVYILTTSNTEQVLASVFFYITATSYQDIFI